jgi:hypothetical protein
MCMLRHSQAIVVLIDTDDNSVFKTVLNEMKTCSIIIYFNGKLRSIRWVPCHHGMARPQVADSGDPPVF